MLPISLEADRRANRNMPASPAATAAALASRAHPSHGLSGTKHEAPRQRGRGKSTSHSMNKGLALLKMRQCSRTAPPADNSGKCGGGRCLRTRAPKLFGEAEATPKSNALSSLSHTQVKRSTRTLNLTFILRRGGGGGGGVRGREPWRRGRRRRSSKP